jgi:hypothetical protein
MTTTLNASNSGSGGLVATADASGVLALQTAGTTAVTIDTSQNVGIGMTPTNFGNGYTVLQVANVSNGGMLYLTNTANAGGRIYGNGAGITYDAFSTTYHAFNTNGAERVRIDSSGNFQFNSGYGSAATAYGCRAWINFNGGGTPAIRGSGNVSSLTDNGTGDYTINFTTAMPDVNYCSQLSIGNLNQNYWEPIPYIYSQSTSSCRVRVITAAGIFFDQDSNNVSIFR